MMGPIPARCLFGRVRMLSLSAVLTLLVASLSAHAQTYTVIHDFAGKPTDGEYPNGEFALDSAGNFYGTTTNGGTKDYGTIFKMDQEGDVTIVHSFADDEIGGGPVAGLLFDGQSNFYGTTPDAVFRFDEESNAIKALHGFGIGNDGGGTISKMVTNKGDLYFVTSQGDAACMFGCGRILKMTKGGTETVLYAFTGGTDGAFPQGLTRDAAGNLYGVTLENISAPGAGTVFKLDTSGAFSVLYTFSGGADGGTPSGRLTIDANGNMHGVTVHGGDSKCNCGVVFRLDSSGNETVIHKFFGGGGGSFPQIGLLDVGGTLYGTAGGGGNLDCNPPGGCGVLYQIGKTGVYTVLHRFTGIPGDGAVVNTFGRLTLGTDGSIYGATWYGGTSCADEFYLGCGVIFKYTP
jgi:uncharacterized repeat protein (TIGR03803 family)